jgi:hypothetical protein
MYYWDSAYDADYLKCSPNEMLHWAAMQMAIERGIAAFVIGAGCQPSRFSEKFGGTSQPYRIYRKSFIPFLRQVRQIYHFFDRWKNAVWAAPPAIEWEPFPGLIRNRDIPS